MADTTLPSRVRGALAAIATLLMTASLLAATSVGVAAQDEETDVARLREGTELTLKQLGDVMSKFGVERPLSTGETVLADENYIRESILEPQARVVAGYEPVMPTYQGRLKDAVDGGDVLGGGRRREPPDDVAVTVDQRDPLAAVGQAPAVPFEDRNALSEPADHIQAHFQAQPSAGIVSRRCCRTHRI